MLPSSFRCLALVALLAPDPRAQMAHGAWSPGTSYREGEIVLYLGVDYRCLQAHVARAGLEPPAAPGLWRVFTAPESRTPAAPRGLSAVADGPGRIVVGWSQVEGASSYDLLADGVLQAGVHAPYIHRGLAPGTTHAYRVRAVNEAGPGPWSETAACVTSGR
ncbi:MAG TPA: carbohydrate-binding protein [Holophaga sp.]|nr:carbohydrate-binding protein [Holophaga sp.]